MTFKHLFLFLLISCLAQSLQAQKYRPELLNLDSALVKNAHTVIRSSHTELEVLAEDKYILRKKVTATILNEYSPYTQCTIGYSSNISIEDFEGKIYDASGKLLRKVGKKDIIDQSSISSFSIYEDNRIQTLLFKHTTFPYHVEYSYVQKHTGILDLNDFYIQGFNTGVESFINRLIVPADYKINYRSENIALEAKINNAGNTISYQWEAKNLKPITKEKYAPLAKEILPHVALSPVKIDYFNNLGSANNWSEYGQFFFDLNNNRDDLSSTTQQKIIALTKEADSNTTKIKILYKFMQENIRYVSVQLGIGGFQTFDANYVETNQYGDCKAMTNYMKAMLKVIDIPAYAVIIAAGRNNFTKLNPNFTNHFGNHMILYLPLQDQFLECTSNDGPAFYVSEFIHNRSALVLTEEGGVIKKTPTLTAADNSIQRKVEATINEEGAAKLTANIQYTGVPHEQMRYLANNKDKTEQEKLFTQYISLFPNSNITSFDLKTAPDAPQAQLQLTADIPFFATSSGSRLFINPNFITYLPEIPRAQAKRKNDLVLNLAQTEVDEINIQVPKGLKLESTELHEMQNDSPYGSLTREISFADGLLTFKQTLVHKAFRGDPEHYEGYRQWLFSMQKQWQPKVVFKKNLRP